MFTDVGSNGTVSSSGIRITLKSYNFFNPFRFFYPFGCYDLMVSRIGQIALLLLLLEHFGPIRDTITSTVAAAGIVKVKKTLKANRIPELEPVT